MAIPSLVAPRRSPLYAVETDGESKSGRRLTDHPPPSDMVGDDRGIIISLDQIEERYVV